MEWSRNSALLISNHLAKRRLVSWITKRAAGLFAGNGRPPGAQPRRGNSHGFGWRFTGSGRGPCRDESGAFPVSQTALRNSIYRDD